MNQKKKDMIFSLLVERIKIENKLKENNKLDHKIINEEYKAFNIKEKEFIENIKKKFKDYSVKTKRGCYHFSNKNITFNIEVESIPEVENEYSAKRKRMCNNKDLYKKKDELDKKIKRFKLD